MRGRAILFIQGGVNCSHRLLEIVGMMIGCELFMHCYNDEDKAMKITKAQLTEMITETIREQMNGDAPNTLTLRDVGDIAALIELATAATYPPKILQRRLDHLDPNMQALVLKKLNHALKLIAGADDIISKEAERAGDSWE